MDAWKALEDRGYRKCPKYRKIFLEDLCRSAEVESLDDLEQKIFEFNACRSIRPFLMYQSPLDDCAFYMLNYPHIKFATFS